MIGLNIMLPHSLVEVLKMYISLRIHKDNVL